MTEKQKEYYRKYYMANQEKITAKKRAAYKPHRNTHGYFSRQSIERAYEQRREEQRSRFKES